MRTGTTRRDFLNLFYFAHHSASEKLVAKKHLNEIQEGDLWCGDIPGRRAR